MQTRHALKSFVLIALAAFVGTAQAATYGRTAAQFGVSSLGSAQYSVPFSIPRGVGGVQPNLSISYDSQSGDGILGLGWSLSGLGSISRCTRTSAQDASAAPITLTADDGYCLNGQRLRKTSGTYGADGSTYQTEVDQLTRVTAYGTAGGGPQYFIAESRSGLIYEYGNTTDSRVTASGATTPYQWALNRVRDRYGNNYKVSYSTGASGSAGIAVPSSISYSPTSAGATTYSYIINIAYGPRPTSHALTGFMAGYSTVNNNEISSISLTDGTNTIRQMAFSYEASPTTGRNRIKALQECTTECLAPSAFNYQDGGMGVNSSGTIVSSGGVGIYDFNGDGKTDLLYWTASGYQIALSNGSGYGALISTGVTDQRAAIGDLLGNGLTGLIGNNGGTLWYYTLSGNTAMGQSTGIPNDTSVQRYLLADLDGNGKPALVAQYQSYITARTNISSNSTPAFAGAVTIGTIQIFNNGSATISTGSGVQAGSLLKVDFNGDGRQDLLVTTDWTIGGPANGEREVFTNYEYISNGSTNPVSIVSLPSGQSADKPLFLNWNDDACTDAVFHYFLYISGCNGTNPVTYNLPTAVVAAMDWDGDGRTDLLVANGSTLGVYRATGSNYLDAMLYTSIPYSTGSYYQQTDLDGDGLDDLLITSSSLTYYRHNNPGQLPDLVKSFADGYGLTYSPQYVPMSYAPTSVFEKGTGAVYPQLDYAGPRNVVSAVTASDGVGGTYTTSHYYHEAVVNLQGRGFLGFASTRSDDSRNGLRYFKHYFTDFPKTGMLLSESVNQPTTSKNIKNINYHLSVATWDATPNNERYFPYVDTATTYTYEVGGAMDGSLIATSAVNYGTPDSAGNFTRLTTTLTDNDTGSPQYNSQWTSVTQLSIAPDFTHWCLGLPTERDVTNTAPNAPTLTRRVAYSVDTTACRTTGQTIEPNGTYQVSTAYQFDGFGNINSQQVTGLNMAARTTTTDWGTSGQFPVTVTNALGESSVTHFDPNTGQPADQTDPNGIETSWQYDNFGRKTKEVRADGTSTTWSYDACATAGCLNPNNKMTLTEARINADGTQLTRQKTYLDLFDRTLATSKPLLSGADDKNEVKYDKFGHVQYVYAPCVAGHCNGAFVTTNTYDLIDRLVSSSRPINAGNTSPQTTQYSYQGRSSVVTDPQGKSTTTIAQVTGDLSRTQDANGYYVQFNHDAFGSVSSVSDSSGNTLRSTTYVYGAKAFVKSVTDMDMGSWSFTPNALGEVTHYQDAKGQTFDATYDALSRPLTRTEPDLTTNWTWGSTPASYNVDKLVSVTTSASGGTTTDAYTYESHGHPLTRTLTLPSIGNQVFNYYFDSNTGLLVIVKFPVSAPSNYRLSVNYQYAHGILKAVRDQLVSSTVWWQADTADARGQVTQETTTDLSGHPAVVTSSTFDEVTGWKSSAQTGVSGGAALQNESYLYDQVGNLTQRQNNNRGLTENFYYDNLYRLDHSTVGSATTTMHYDALGNITARSDVAGGATWTYDPARKHAVLQAGSSANSYSYDANGNAKTRNGANVAWTSYNYVAGVSSGSESASFDYGADRQRWRMVYTAPGVNETTYYVTPQLERVVTASGTEYRHYIMAGNRPVVLVSRSSSGAVTTRSLLLNNQGSIASIIDSASGTTQVEESFTPFGNRRSAISWNGAPSAAERSSADAITREGYTFQTVLGSMGLNHMNGRIEDAVTGRFLSADPIGTDPHDTQSYNRYSYVRNSPASGIDPSGFEVLGAWHDSEANKAKYGATEAIRLEAQYALFSYTLWGWYAQVAMQMGFNSGGSIFDFQSGSDSAGRPVSLQGAIATTVANLDSGRQTLSGSGVTGTASFQVCDSSGCSDVVQGTRSSRGQSSQAGTPVSGGGTTTFVDPDNVMGGIIAVGYTQSALHDLIQDHMTAQLRSQGVVVVNGPTICLPGATPCGRPDIFGRNPDTGQLFAIEIKTGSFYDLTPGQVNTYPHFAAGGALVSGDAGLTPFGIFPGQGLPPVSLYFYVQTSIGSPGGVFRGFPPRP